MIASLTYCSVKPPQNHPDKGAVMSIRYSKQMMLLCFLLTLPWSYAMAGSFLDALLRFTGISITTSQVRGSFIRGNIWLVSIDKSGANQAKQITRGGTYHSPLWVPGSDKILAMKEDKLIQFNIEGGEEKMLHSLSKFTILLGFDKSDSNSILVINGSVPAVFLLDSGQVKLLPYDKENSEDRGALDGLMSGFRDYGNTEVFIEKQGGADANGVSKKINKIHIKSGEQDLVISCPAECGQPALREDGGWLVFVGQ